MNDNSTLVRLGDLFPSMPEGDRASLEHIWIQLDHALQHCRLDVQDIATTFRTVRAVTALGLIRVHVDVDACEVWASAIQEDGTILRIGRGLPATRLFGWSWWLRFAFQRWAPECSAIDFIEDPLNRPSNVEMDTCQWLIRRLSIDPRFWSLSEEFDAAVGIPSLAVELVEEVHHWRGLEYVSEAWRLMERVDREIHKALASLPNQ